MYNKISQLNESLQKKKTLFSKYEPQVKAYYKLTSTNERPQTPLYVMTEPAIYTFFSM